MGIFSRMKRAIKSKANAAVDKAIDPKKELQMAIFELEEQRKLAYKELLSYKTTAKQMEQDIERREAKIRDYDKKAMVAVKAGDDELAKECLRLKKQTEAELVKIRRDRDEAAGHAIALNKSRKEVETRLKILKLKQGTMATQLAAARSGTGNAFGHSEEVFDKLERAEDAIEGDAIQAEVATSMLEEEEGVELERQIARAASGVDDSSGEDDALAALKAKMAEEKKKLPPAE